MCSYRGSDVDLAGALAPPLQTSRSYRLSKPRACTSSSLNLVATSSWTDLSSPTSAKQSPTISRSGTVDASPSNCGRVYRESRQKMREYLFGGADLAVDDGDRSDVEDTQKGPVDTSRGIKERITKTGSFLAKRASLRITLTNPSKSQSTLSLGQFSPVEGLEEETVVDQIKVKAMKDRLAALNHKSSTEDAEADQVISPIRRRSLFTPGLATRNPNDILRKPPPPPDRSQTETDRERFYNPYLSEFSPLARLAALDLANRSFSPEPRCGTPSDVNYGNLGCLGSLRITNGVASPVPSVRSTVNLSRNLTPDFRRQKDYFTVSEGRCSDNEEPVPVLKEIHRRSGDFVDAIDTQKRVDRRSDEIGRVGKSLTKSPSAQHRPSSPLKHERICVHSSDDESYTDEAYSSSMAYSQPSQSVSAYRSSVGMAQSYISELPDSPFAQGVTSTLEQAYFEATTKPNEMEDDLFEAQSLRSTYSQQSLRGSSPRLADITNNRRSFRDEALSIESPRSRIPSHDFTGEYFHAAPKTSNKPTDEKGHQTTVLTKSDSGYSSNTSLKSLRPNQDIIANERTSVPMMIPTNTEQPSDARKEPARRHVLSVMGPLRPLPLTIPNAIPDLQSTGDSGNTSYKASSSTIPTVSSDRTGRSPQLNAPKKLQKARPKSQPPPVDRITVQSPWILEPISIPSVSVEAAARNAERVRQFPPLDHTLPSVDHGHAQDDHLTMAPLSAPLRFPSPCSPKNERRSTSRANHRKAESPRGNGVTNDKHLWKPLPKLPTEKGMGHQQAPAYPNVAETIADFGDVTHSLGGGPYDVAHNRPRRSHESKKSSRLHPHQMSATASQPRSTVGMSEEEAAELSRLRNMYRRSSLDAHPRSEFPPSRPFTHTGGPPSRRHFNDRGGIPGKMPHPARTHSDTPPVPTIPVSMQVERKEAEIALWTPAHAPLLPAPRSKSHHGHTALRSAQDEPLDDPQSHDAPAARHLTAAAADKPSQPQSLRPVPKPARLVPLPPQTQSRHPENDLVGSRSYSSSALEGKAASAWTSRPQESTDRPNIAPGTVARLSGRYEGGFGFGYEPGRGVGGSAGTRAAAAGGASPKRVDVRRGWGMDLSDVPVFVRASS